MGQALLSRLWQPSITPLIFLIFFLTQNTTSACVSALHGPVCFDIYTSPDTHINCHLLIPDCMYTVMEFVRVYLGPWSFSGDLLVPSVVVVGSQSKRFHFFCSTIEPILTAVLMWMSQSWLQYYWANLDCSTIEPILTAVLLSQSWLQYYWANLDCSTTEPILTPVLLSQSWLQYYWANLDPIQYVAAVRGLQ